ncbi:nuclear transport factor 2 family protein [Streptomyces gilvosporeus]|uniref:Serine/arginine repetitive matrix protein 1 n=1 Tax=Streptomyces gilvosporeus TaxID=553510 RepID=A0A1V0TNB2_9ACTN|nr:nuclear transport factor 2 family protein [Streptomyces gilvosporeus]ARF54278.1 serine/arginine repetitive matrix protein 1 [Streptomyces gilvosporeus]
MTAAERFRAAVESRDLAVLDDLFTDDIRFYSPVKFTPFEGKPMVLGLFGVLLRTFEDFRYVGDFTGSSETSADGTVAPSAVLLFRATVNGKEIHGIDLLHLDGDGDGDGDGHGGGRIKEFTVMVRPQSAVHALSEAVLAGLVAEGLVPAPPAGDAGPRPL